MQVIFNHPLMYVIDYPERNTIEMLDKRCARVGVMEGRLAERFRHEFGIFLAEERDIEQLEDFMEHYSAVLDQPVSHH